MTHSIRFHKIVLVFFVSVLLTPAATLAQHNTEYKFRQQAVGMNSSYGSNSDPHPALTMNCLAANGYGQWTLTSDSGNNGTMFPAGWCLLANGIYKPSTHYNPTDVTDHPGSIPPGVVQCGSLFGGVVPTEAEVTANLNGAVDFVWPDRTMPGTPFVVQQFTDSEIDISLSFLSNPTPPMNVVTGPIRVAAPEITTVSPCLGWITPPFCYHNVVTEAIYQDEFQIASDARYLYIVWCSDSNICTVPTTECWATVVDRTTLMTVTGWPQDLGNGVRPTVACDPRNNRSGTISPAFEIAWLRLGPSPVIRRNTCRAGLLGSPYSLYPAFINPVTGATILYNFLLHARILVSSAPGVTPKTAVYATIVDSTADTALVCYRSADTTTSLASYVDGARMLTHPSPILGNGCVKDNFITAIANAYDYNDRHDTGTLPDQFHCVYQFSTLTGTHPLLIVEGSDNGAAHPFGTTDTRLVLNQSNPSTLLPDPTSYVAAVNQMGIHVHWISTDSGVTTHYYSRDTGRAFDESIEENTLMTDICTITDGTSHGGTVGATILPNITMAIWTDPNYGFSLTNPDSGLYQPRTYGTSFPHIAVIDNHVGQLDFVGENVKLNVGWATGIMPAGNIPANLTDMPYFYFNFLGSNRGATQGVVVNGTWNYYGLIAVHDSTTDTASLVASPFTNNNLLFDDGYLLTDTIPGETGGGSIQIGTYLTGSGVWWDSPATLIVHGGADFYCGEWTSFTIAPDVYGMSGNIDARFDGDVFPIHNSYHNTSDTTGRLTLGGKTILMRNAPQSLPGMAAGGCLEGHIPTGKDIILFVQEEWDPGDHPGDSTIQFNDSNFTFFNSSNNATGVLKIGDYNSGDTNYDEADGGDIVFNGGLADAIQMHFVDPKPDLDPFLMRNYTIENMTFNDLSGQTIFFENDGDPVASNYGNILINGNNFLSFEPSVGGASILGVYMKNFDGPLSGFSSDGINSGTITISNNTFLDTNNHNTNAPDENCPSSAIALENSTAWVLENTIEDKGYMNGITNWATTYNTDLLPDPSHSFICRNFISGLQFDGGHYTSTYEVGVYSSYYNGYFKLNTITNCDDAYITYGNDFPMFVADTIFGNHYNTLISQYGSVVDLSGIHSTDSSFTDAAGFNTITGPSTIVLAGSNNTSLINLDASSNIILANSSEHWHWTQFGENNIFVSPRAADSITQPIIQVAGAGGTGIVQIGSVDSNYFGGRNPALGSGFTPGCSTAPCTDGCGADPSKWNPSDTNEIDALSIEYCASPGATTTSGIIAKPFFDCGEEFEDTRKGKNPKPMSVLSVDSLSEDECIQLYNFGVSASDNGEYLQSYDSLKKYIDSCANNSYPSSFSAFSRMSEDVSELQATDTAIATDYQMWLRSVLYLDTTNPEYFCQCAEQIGWWIYHPTSSMNDSIGVLQYDTSLAVLYWLIQHTTCDTPHLWHQYEADRGAQYDLWQESGRGALDTTLPPLPPALDSLLNRHFLYAGVSEPPQPGILSNASASPNPVTDGTVIYFSIAKEAYVRINLFDVLGHQIASTGFESLFQPGNYDVPLSLQNLPSGTYFARIMTAYGEVQTVKLVKE